MGGGGFEPPKQTQQIYSLSPLATREPTHNFLHHTISVSNCQSTVFGSLTVEYKKNACRPYKTCFFYVNFFTFISVILCYCVL